MLLKLSIIMLYLMIRVKVKSFLRTVSRYNGTLERGAMVLFGEI